MVGRSALCLLALSLASSTVRAQSPELPRGALPVLDHEGVGPYVVLRVRTEAAWGRGPLRLLRRDWPTVVTRALALDALPSAARQDARGTFALSDGRRIVCRARLGRPQLLRHVTPEFEYPRWNGEEGGRRFTDAEVAQAAWDLREGHELLVARVIAVRTSGERPACRGAAWARQAPLAFSAAATADDALLTTFRSLPPYLELAGDWEQARDYDADPTAEHWDAREGTSFRYVEALVVDGRRFVLITAAAHGGCGDFTGGVWALFAQTVDGYEPIAHGRSEALPDRLADFDGDGMPELLGWRSILLPATGERIDVDAAFLGCSC